MPARQMRLRLFGQEPGGRILLDAGEASVVICVMEGENGRLHAIESQTAESGILVRHVAGAGRKIDMRNAILIVAVSDLALSSQRRSGGETEPGRQKNGRQLF